MGETNSLRLVLDRLAVDDSRLELLDDGPMDGVTLHGVSFTVLPSSQGLKESALTKSSTVHLFERNTTGDE